MIFSLKLISPILQADDLCVVSTIRQRPPHKLITSYNLPRHIPMTLHVHLPRLLIHTPSLTMSFANSPANSIFALSIHLYTSASPGFTDIISNALNYNYIPFYLHKNSTKPTPKRDFSSAHDKIHTKRLYPSLLIFLSHHSPFLIYTGGSYPDQYSVHPSNPAAWGIFFSRIFLDHFGSVGALHFEVNGPN